MDNDSYATVLESFVIKLSFQIAQIKHKRVSWLGYLALSI